MILGRTITGVQQSACLGNDIRELTIKFANSPPCACRGSTGQKP